MDSQTSQDGSLARASTDQQVTLVGIGASAGGLEALREFVGHLSPNGVMAYVVAQHLSPTHRSMLMELLARETELKVQELERPCRPVSDVVYITPPNKNLELEDGLLTVRTPKRKSGPIPSVDVFFASLALEHEDNAIGIILSGTGSDGARGIQAIKAAGGITLAQDDTAKYDGMPRAATATGCVDLVLPAKEIATKLAALGDRPTHVDLLGESSHPPEAYEEIMALLRTHAGVDFADYRASTIYRRIVRRSDLLHLGGLSDYLKHLRDKPEEVERLSRELLIGVTSFFRDPKAFEALSKEATRIVTRAGPRGTVRAWVAACSTGQEAYSIAILFLEAMRHTDVATNLQLFATDLDAEAIRMARRGQYPGSIVEHLDKDLLDRYFSPLGPEYVVKQSVRDSIIFSRQNVIEDPPFSKLDLISCRNLFIYFTPVLQKRALERFHYSLRGGGLLFLGKSEAISENGDYFQLVDRKYKIFRAVSGVASPFKPSGLLTSQVTVPEAARLRRRIPENREAPFFEAIVDTFGPPTVIIDQAERPLHISGDVSPYLQIPSGMVRFDLSDIIKPELRAELRAILLRSKREGVVVSSRLHLAEHDGDRWQYRVEVHPYHDRASDQDLFLLAFRTVRVDLDDLPDQPESELPDQLGAKERIDELEHELVSMREHLQTMVEELETSNEELQSLNEELQASNEELQSTNEELETSNEELQSTNEELTTVNEELVVKTDALNETNTFLSNILESIGHPIVVTGRDFKVLHFNSGAEQIFDVSKTDLGSSILELRPKSRLPDLREMVEAAVATGRVRSKRTKIKGRSYQLYVHPCLDEQDATIGTVVVFDDVSKLVASNVELRRSQRELALAYRSQAATLDSLPAHVALLDRDGKIVVVNQNWRQFASSNGYEGEDFCVGVNYLDICENASGDCASEAPMMARKLREVLSGVTHQFEFRYPCHSPTQERWFKCIVRAVRSAKQQQSGAVVMHIDETRQVTMEQSIAAARDLAESASSAKSNFLTNMSHELRTPLNAIIGFSELQKKQIHGDIGHPKYLEYASDVNDAAHELLAMIDQVLDLSKVEAGGLEMEESLVSLEDCRNTVFKMLGATAAREHVVLTSEIPAGLPLLRADQRLVCQMLSNLVANAIKFTEPNGHVSVAAGLAKLGGMALTVSDTGIGIAEADLQRIVEPFSQVRATLTSENSGVGIGLALVNSMIGLHQGELTIDSVEGEGTRVSLLFPPERCVGRLATNANGVGQKTLATLA